MQARYFEVDLAGGEQALESMMCLGGGVVFLASSSSGWTYYCELTVQYIPSSICSVQIYHISVQEVGSYQDARSASATTIRCGTVVMDKSVLDPPVARSTKKCLEVSSATTSDMAFLGLL